MIRLRAICQPFLRDIWFFQRPARVLFLLRAAGHFTSTFTRIQGWMQHSKRCSPFDTPVMWTWLQTGGRNVSGATEQGSLLVRRDLLYRSPSEEPAGGQLFGLPCSSATSDFEPGGRT